MPYRAPWILGYYRTIVSYEILTIVYANGNINTVGG
jgi:hypothetical protein